MTGVEKALDTSIAIACLNGKPDALRHLAATGPIALPITVVAELLFGAMKSGRSEKNLVIYNRFIDNAVLLDIDRGIASRYAELKSTLSKAGRPIPENDIWIAATCLHLDLTLVTADAHFAECPHLRLENWLQPAEVEQ
jgi:tRNA(fMet)-specific endonuclease VapC